MAEYFGHNIDETGEDAWSSNIFWEPAYECPGTGSMSVLELGGRVRVTTGSQNFRAGIYTAAGAFVMQTGQITVTETSLTWKSGTTFYDVSLGAIGSPVLTGGSSYILALVFPETSTIHIAAGSGGSYSAKSASGSYVVNGLPATLPSPDDTGTNFLTCVRCQVETGGGATTTELTPTVGSGILTGIAGKMSLGITPPTEVS